MTRIIFISLTIIIALTLSSCSCTKTATNNNQSLANDVGEAATAPLLLANSNVNAGDDLIVYETDEEIQKRIEGMSELEKAEAKTRDEKRIADIKSIQAALELFNTEKGNYPETSDELVNSGYLSAWPKDPKEGETEDNTYTYTPIGKVPAQYYDLSYYLEIGVEEISAGLHVANPDGLANL